MLSCNVCNISICSVYYFKQHLLTKNHIANITKQHQQSNPVNQLALIQANDSNTHNNQITGNKTNNNPNYCCKYCSNSYYSNYNLKRHYDTCKKFAEYMTTEKRKIMHQNMIDGGMCNVSLQSGADTIVQPINIIINNNITNNNNILNGNLNVAFCNSVDKNTEFYDFWKGNKVNPVGFENMEMLNNQAIADKIHGAGLNAFMEYIKAIYSNKDNHNVSIYNKRDKLVKYISANGNVEITTLNKILDMLVMNNIDGLDMFLDRKDISIRQSYKNIIDKLKFIHEQDGNNPYLEKYIKELYLIILNISQSALSKITELENMLANTSNDLLLNKEGLQIPRTNFRTVP